MVKIVPDTGVLVEHNNKGIFVYNRICHKLFICRTVAGELLLWIRVAAEDVKPSQHVIIVRVGTGAGVRIGTPDVTKLVITATDIDADAGVVNRFHYFYPGAELSFELVRAG
jgi:hypothetical protein